MPSPARASPIPAGSQPSPQRSKVFQSSLDLVFSYSRSQQLLYGKSQNAPSFLETSSHSHSPDNAFPSRDEEDVWDRGVDGTETPENVERRRSSASPIIFTADPFTSSTVDTDNQDSKKGYGTIAKMLSTSSNSQKTHPGYRVMIDKNRKEPEQMSERTALLTDLSLPPQTLESQGSSAIASEMRRRSSVRKIGRDRRRSSRRQSEVFRGQSTDGQTLFNAVAVLLGIGVLSLPLAFAYAGWIAGTAMLLGFAWLTCHTAKLLARLIKADPSMLGYTDIGRAAFGRYGGIGINMLFCLELFALGVALIVLFGDTLEVLFPSMSANTFKLVEFFFVLPTTLLPLHLLSLPSLLSTVSTLLLVIIILVNGLFKTSSPGSILHPSPTDWLPELTNANWLGGIGLVLAGFGGHAVVPSLARDMKNPEHFDKVIDWAFAIAAGVSFIAGAAGYLMIGNVVSDEITRDLMQPKYGYPRWLNVIALWMIVIIPLTKFGLCSRPLNIAIETLLGLTAAASGLPESAISIDEEVADQASNFPSAPPSPGTHLVKRRVQVSKTGVPRYKLLRVITRTIVTSLCTLTAILLPGFGKVMAFLGSFSAFLICIILPLGFYLRLEGRLLPDQTSSSRARIAHWLLIICSLVAMTAGTVWAFLPGSGHGDLEV